MLGPILTFLGVCALVAIYMSIVHWFLREAEKPDEFTMEQSSEKKQTVHGSEVPGAPRAQWAH